MTEVYRLIFSGPRIGVRGDQVMIAFGFKFPQDGGAGEAGVVGDIDFRIFLHDLDVGFWVEASLCLWSKSSRRFAPRDDVG